MNDQYESIQSINTIVGQLFFTRLRITFEALQDIQLYEYNGSAYRGCLSETLRRLFCTTSYSECNLCPKRFDCPHAVVIHSFTPLEDALASKYPYSPNPYLIVPEPNSPSVIKKGSTFGFDFVMIGDKASYVRPLIEAFHQMGMTGIGRKRGKYRLIAVQCLHPDLSYKSLSDNQEPPTVTLKDLPHPTVNRYLTLDFETNLRLMVPGVGAMKQKKVPLEIVPDFSLLMTRLVDRMLNVAYFHCGAPNTPVSKKWDDVWKDVEVTNHSLTFHQWVRHSGTQKKRLLFDGLRGSITYTGNFSPWMPVLTLGQWLHVGSSTSFGLGKYVILQNERTPL
jgi:hypothetical protein